MRILREISDEQRATNSRLAVLRQDLDSVEHRTRAPSTAMPLPTAAMGAATAAPSSAPAASAHPAKRQRKEKGQYVKEQTSFLVNLAVLEDKVPDWKKICKEILQAEYKVTAAGTPTTRTIREVSEKAAVKMWENEA